MQGVLPAPDTEPVPLDLKLPDQIQVYKMKTRLVAVGVFSLAAFTSTNVIADEQDARHSHEIEEVVVTAAFQKIAAETALPITVLSGEKLQEQVANTLGETLQSEIGMANASFGTGVGHPIIRGQTGNRVKVLQNGAGVTDASNVSPDHANGVATVLADRVEVVRGPSTLLYGSGAIGGVVNVIDGRIPDSLSDKPRFDIQQNWDSVNDQSRTVARVDFSAGNIAFHLEGFTQDSNDADINGFALDEAALELIEELARELHDEDHDEGHDEEHDEELTNTRGFIGNSDSESDGYSFGFSWVGDRGFIGISYSELNNEYGLPLGVHAHHHHDEEHDEDHHDDEHEDEHDEHGEAVEFVRIGMEKRRLDLRGEYNFNDDLVKTLRFSIGQTDYEHSEIEVFEDGSSAIGTLFENDGIEGRATLDLRLSPAWSAVIGTQFSSLEFSATGEEAFIPETDIDANGLFMVAQYNAAKYNVELGIRSEWNDVDPAGAGCDYSDTSLSASASLLYEFNDENNLMAGLSRSERAPSIEELFSNISGSTCIRPADDEELVFHAATNLLEIGNPDLDNEVATNIELGWRKHTGRVRGELNFYYNEISDYIYLDITREEVDEQPISIYEAKDAEFTGVEAKLDISLIERDNLSLEMSVFGDTVRAKFDDGGDIPRIAPGKIGTSFALFGEQWSAHLGVTRVLEQDRTAELELETDGYTRVSFYGDYHWQLGNAGQMKLFVQGSNLLDEEIRNHASLLKHYAPEPGRNIRVGLRYTY